MSQLKGKKPVFAGYFDNIFEVTCRDRYKAKINDIGCDPYEISGDLWEDDVEKWPAITYANVGFYLLQNLSSFTQNEFQSYKSWKSYTTFTNGWVHFVHVHPIGEKVLAIAKVRV